MDFRTYNWEDISVRNVLLLWIWIDKINFRGDWCWVGPHLGRDLWCVRQHCGLRGAGFLKYKNYASLWYLMVQQSYLIISFLKSILSFSVRIYWVSCSIRKELSWFPRWQKGRYFEISEKIYKINYKSLVISCHQSNLVLRNKDFFHISVFVLNYFFLNSPDVDICLNRFFIGVLLLCWKAIHVATNDVCK